jgi:hypothetical protein
LGARRWIYIQAQIRYQIHHDQLVTMVVRLCNDSRLRRWSIQVGQRCIDKSSHQIPYTDIEKTAVIMLCLYISMFLVALDRTILATAIPRITDEFNSIDVSTGPRITFRYSIEADLNLGYRVVWLFISPNGLRFHFTLWTSVYFLSHKMGLPLRHLSL